MFHISPHDETCFFCVGHAGQAWLELENDLGGEDLSVGWDLGLIGDLFPGFSIDQT